MSRAVSFHHLVASALVLATLVAAVAANSAFVGRTPMTYTLLVHVARVHSEQDIEAEFIARSSPESPKFRQFLTKAGLTELVRGRDASLTAVWSYFRERAENLQLLDTHDIVTCDVTEATAVRLGFTKVAKPGRYRASAPSELAAHVRFMVLLAKGIDGSNEPPRRVGKSNAGEPGMTQTPITIGKRYQWPADIPTLPSNYSQGVAEFEGEYFLETDMDTFIKTYHLENVTIRIMGPDVANSGADAIEGTLDLQYMASVAKGKIHTWWLAQNTDNNDPGNIDFSLWCSQVLALSPVPYVVSISWGMGYERYIGDEGVLFTDNDAFRKLGLMGVSVFAASGDSGPGDRSGVFNCNTFVPGWPASSPYLTSVGATYADNETAAEVAVKWSGGGFSTVFGRPSYQESAVSHYLSSTPNLPNASFYNASGRGYPDVSALGTNFNVFVNGQWEPISGTSCASPTFAGMVSLIVAERLAQGQSALGFLNPKLYQLGRVGFDVTSGQSQDTNCIPFLPLPGFPATTGWDAVSGLGTPNYEYLKANL